ncbi:MAG: PQQ-binding-like beta-propeller repeat protein, partial [Candidatus Bathyarchaeia archaeon]
YLWTTVGTTWKAYDPFTGRWEWSIRDVLSGTNTVGPNGEILRYTLDLTNGWMIKWNSTRVVHQTYWDYYKSRPADAAQADYYSGRWRPHGIVFNYTKGIQWNVTIPRGLPGALKDILGEDRILGSNTNWSGGNQQPNPVFWAISIKPGDEGRLIFNVSWPLPSPDLHVDIPGSLPVSLEDKVFVVAAKETRVYYGFDLDTGKQIWGPTSPPEPLLNAFTNLYMAPWGQSKIAYGKLYTAGMAGVVNAYDVKTGQHLWQYNITDPYTEQLFSQNWPAPINFIVDGKIYLFHQEHSANTPMPRGAPAVCLNATTGEEIWRINGLRLGTRWGGQPVIADSIIVGFSSYDNRIVAIGRGPSCITVSAPEVGVTLGKSVLVKGMVTDISPGTKDPAITMRFPHGVPAVADECMSDWMLYVYQQHPRPANVKGVEVVVSVLDPNGNCYEVGRATSDANGMFSLVFEPPVPGKYTVIASFAGSKSYWSSSAETALFVEEAPPVSPPPTPPPQAPVEAYFAVSTLAIIVAIVIIGVLLLRKKP